MAKNKLPALPTQATENLVFEFRKGDKTIRHTVRKHGFGVEVRTLHKGRETFNTITTDESRAVFKAEKARGGNGFRVLAVK